MAERCTIMTVVPRGGNTTPPLLGCGPAVLWGDAPAVAFLDAGAGVEAPACGAPLDDEVVAWLVPEAEPATELALDPPHAASSSTSDPSPVTAAHPLLRITSLHFARMTRSRGSPSRPGPHWGEAETKRS